MSEAALLKQWVGTMDQHVQSVLNQNTAQQQREKYNLRMASKQYGGKPVGQSQIYRPQQEQQLGTLNQFELGRIHSIQNVLNTERDRLKDENHEIQNHFFFYGVMCSNYYWVCLCESDDFLHTQLYPPGHLVFHDTFLKI